MTGNICYMLRGGVSTLRETIFGSMVGITWKFLVMMDKTGLEIHSSSCCQLSKQEW